MKAKIVISFLIIAITILSSIQVIVDIADKGNVHTQSQGVTAITSAENASYVSKTFLLDSNTTYNGYHQFSGSNGNRIASYYSPSNKFLYTTVGPTNIAEFNTTSGHTEKIIKPQLSPSPEQGVTITTWVSGITYDVGDGLLYVTVVSNFNGHYQYYDRSWLCSLKPSNGSIIWKLPLDSYTSGIAYDAKNGLVYVDTSALDLNSSYIDSPSVLYGVDPYTHSIDTHWTTPGLALEQIAFNPYNNQIYVPNYFQGSVSIFNTSNGSKSTVILPGGALITFPVFLAFSKNYLVEAGILGTQVSVIDLNNNTVVRNFHFSDFSQFLSVAFDPSSSTIYLAKFWGSDIMTITGLQNPIYGNVSSGSLTQSMVYNSNTGLIYAIGLGGTPHISVITRGPTHLVKVDHLNVVGNPKWSIQANGVTHYPSRGNLALSIAGNSTTYSVKVDGPYFSLPWSGSVSTGNGATIKVVFISDFVIIIPAIIGGGYLIAAKATKQAHKRHEKGLEKSKRQL